MTARLHVPLPLHDSLEGAELDLPDGAARHVQVLRLQPGSALTLFDGRGAECAAEVTQMTRSAVRVRLGAHRIDLSRELALPVTLALGVPANERMDTLVEKACELGVAALQPLLCERSVLRLAGERAARKVAHWQAVAVAACEQCGRTVVPRVEPLRPLNDWLSALPAKDDATLRLVLSLRDTQPLPSADVGRAVLALSGPEGGLSEAEEDAARLRGFVPVSLGPRVLRADTAPLALLAHLALAIESPTESQP